MATTTKPESRRKKPEGAPRRGAKASRPVPSATSDTFELTWPYFMYVIVLCFTVTTVVLWVWSMWIPAPLETIADPTKTPNPSKAPWYFVGLQELLVYFDPWIAGVVLPGLIIAGLMAIPYLDKNPHGIGEYDYRNRKFAWWVFSLGTLFWFVLIIIGAVFRGPNWQWYWPWESWEVAKENTAVVYSWGFVPGLLFLMSYFGLGMLLPVAVPHWLSTRLKAGSRLQPLCNTLKQFYARRGPLVYSIEMFLLLAMLGIPVKMVLRLVFNVQYILTIPGINLNI